MIYKKKTKFFLNKNSNFYDNFNKILLLLLLSSSTKLFIIIESSRSYDHISNTVRGS